ncbi:hypothetical protein F4561_003300 [Lipingzhangella halophila]|uniref:GmrSD restriction endonucleases C-terminal domain-containing protein n=1 Tax=Lipingzhangella halophila TaxID=1783352 RepID=A0A7W7RIE6_9ACTN|nr:HNH endonuclease family protein [Lipingzhangella halophila]MBB4932480.1 hypothetical protein [Lipingzhangella halophila]
MPTPLRRIAGSSAAAIGIFALLLGPAAPAQAAPPPPPSLEEARAQLDGLTVQPEEDAPGYSRDLFPHWSTVEGNCNSRELVLQRDGEGVEVGEDCYPTSGTWTSPFDGAVTDDPSEASVDHFVPLKEAWDSGASDWSTDRREEFANDLDTPQLWAVSASSNSSKGDSDPAEWMPPETGIHCDYAKSWIAVKHAWDLPIDPDEEQALTELLDSTC